MPKQARTKPRGSRANEKMLRTLFEFIDLTGINPYYLIPMGSGYSINEYFKKYGSIYRDLVRQRQDDYIALDNIPTRKQRDKQKRQIAEEIVKRIHSLKGMFVEWLGDDWKEVTDMKRLVKDKTMQSLRQGAPRRRQELRKKLRTADTAGDDDAFEEDFISVLEMLRSQT